MGRFVAVPELANTVIGGRYRLERLLGAGGMGEVWAATDTRLDRPVAVKIVRSGLAADPAVRLRFESEARSAARLHHPNVVAVYDQGSEGDTVFLAMEYVPGGTLRDLLRHRGRLTPSEALPLYEQMLAALANARARCSSPSTCLASSSALAGFFGAKSGISW